MLLTLLANNVMIPKPTPSSRGVDGLSKSSSVGRSGIQYEEKSIESNRIIIEDSEIIKIVELVLKNFII